MREPWKVVNLWTYNLWLINNETKAKKNEMRLDSGDEFEYLQPEYTGSKTSMSMVIQIAIVQILLKYNFLKWEGNGIKIEVVMIDWELIFNHTATKLKNNIWEVEGHETVVYIYKNKEGENLGSLAGVCWMGNKLKGWIAIGNICTVWEVDIAEIKGAMKFITATNILIVHHSAVVIKRVKEGAKMSNLWKSHL